VKRAVAGLAVVAVVAGCGAYTKADFTASADAICASAIHQTRSIAPPTFSSSRQAQLRALSRYLTKALPVVQSEAAHIRALQRPSEDARYRAVLKRYLTALAQSVSDYRELSVGASRGDAAGVAEAEAALRVSPVTSLATSYGLRSCETPGATVA
jgi:hypothetical protein